MDAGTIKVRHTVLFFPIIIAFLVVLAVLFVLVDLAVPLLRNTTREQRLYSHTVNDTWLNGTQSVEKL